MKIGLVVLGLVAILIALIGWSTLSGPRFRVEVCMTYAGQTACRKVSAKSEAAALRSGAENACADIASGVTDTMKCGQSEPSKITWLSKPSA